MIDDRVAELEDGFKHLLEGVLAVVKVLRDENATLRARLDERRLMGAERSNVIMAPIPEPVVPPSSPPLALVGAVEVPPKKYKYPPRLVTKTCEECGHEITVRAKTRFCRDCFGNLAAARMRAARAKQIEVARLPDAVGQ